MIMVNIFSVLFFFVHFFILPLFFSLSLSLSTLYAFYVTDWLAKKKRKTGKKNVENKLNHMCNCRSCFVRFCCFRNWYESLHHKSYVYPLFNFLNFKNIIHIRIHRIVFCCFHSFSLGTFYPNANYMQFIENSVFFFLFKLINKITDCSI